MWEDSTEKCFILAGVLFFISVIVGIGYSEYLDYNLSLKAVEAGYEQQVMGTKVIWVKTDDIRIEKE
jgi:hypothetical protein